MCNLSISKSSRHGFFEPYFHFKIDLILDIGANTGQFVDEIRNSGFKGRIISFEPLQNAHMLLTKKCLKDSFWEVYPRCAIGDDNRIVDIFESSNSVSSSIRQMGDVHLLAAPESKVINSGKVELIRMDKIFPSLIDDELNFAIKIDTQGYEKEVLLGLGGYLQDILLIQLEMSIVELYQGQALHEEIAEFLKNNDFFLWSLKPGFMNKKSGRLLQYDAIYVNCLALNR